MLPLHAPARSTFARLLRALLAVALPVLLLTSCASEEAAVAGSYLRTFREGVTPDVGLDGTVDRHVLTLGEDGTYTTSHPAMSLQQFDVPMGSGTYRVDGINLVLRSSDPEEGPALYTVSGDTLFPRTSNHQRMGEQVTGYSMGVGEKAYLLRMR